MKLWVPGRKRWKNCSTQISGPGEGWAKYASSAFSIAQKDGSQGFVGWNDIWMPLVCQEAMMCVDRMEPVRMFDLSFTCAFSYNFHSNIVRWAVYSYVIDDQTYEVAKWNDLSKFAELQESLD